jgi:general secretion pathway protein G
MHIKKKNQKKSFTLIELMVVIALIGIIGGVLTYNLKGSLEKGKVFKTQESKHQIKNILNLASIEENISIEEVVINWEHYIRNSPLIQNPEKIINDAWNHLFEVSYYEDNIVIQSRKLQAYYRKHNLIPDPEDEPFI